MLVFFQKVPCVFVLLSFLTCSDFLYRDRSSNRVKKVTLLNWVAGVRFLSVRQFQWLCVCIVQTVVIVDSIINFVLGSFGVHWVTGRLQAGGVGSVTHSLMPDLSLCVSTQTNTHTSLSLLSSREGTQSFYSRLSLWGKPRYNTFLSNFAIDTVYSL